MQLTRAVVKKHTWSGDAAYKYHLAQPSRMISRMALLWNKAIIRRMKRKPTLSRPLNFPMELFLCLKTILLIEDIGGILVKTTRCIEIITVSDYGQLILLFYQLANKYKKTLEEVRSSFRIIP